MIAAVGNPLVIGLIAQAMQAGLELYRAQGMSEEAARDMVRRDMESAAVNAGLATGEWKARKRPVE